MHKCNLDYGITAGYRPAINYCCEHEDGTLHVSNDEYESQVNFCPVCGYEAKVKIKTNNNGKENQEERRSS